MNQTPWGTVETDADGNLWIRDTPVVTVDTDGYYVVTAEAGVYVARWLDENGVKREATYVRRTDAVRRAEESWGR